jgi:hypothetical protein
VNDTIVVQDPGHSILGASSAHRWMNCAGSIQLIDKVLQESGPGGTSYAAAEGTAAHTIAAMCLEDGGEPFEFFERKVDVDGRIFIVDDEMVDGVATMVSGVNGRYADVLDIAIEEAPSKPILHIERTMGSVLNENAWGTADAIIEIPECGLEIFDFKYGRGVVVEPDSAQNKYYGYLAIENAVSTYHPSTVVRLFIVQPRIPHPQGLVRVYATTVEALQAWAYDELLPAMEATQNPNAPLCIGDWCRFCPARNVCPALKQETVGFTTEVEPEHLTGDELGTILAKEKPIIAYFTQLKEEAFKRICKGEEVTGQKLVNKQSNRVWKDDAEVELVRIFGEDNVYQAPKLLTPPNIEKLSAEGKTFVKEWAYKPNAGLTIAPLSDKRKAVKRPMEEFLDRNF